MKTVALTQEGRTQQPGWEVGKEVLHLHLISDVREVDSCWFMIR